MKNNCQEANIAEISTLYQRALNCNMCFDWDIGLKRTTINLPQPRWVGSRYFTEKHQITFVMLNPGAGDKSKKDGNVEALESIKRFRDGNGTFKEMLSFQQCHMKTWGKPAGRFLRFYIEDIGLNLEDVAFLNIALCATEKNLYPAKMLKGCFDKHTGEILCKLKPNLVVLSGRDVWNFESEIKKSCPEAQFVRMLHFAHRKGHTEDMKAQAHLLEVIKGLGKTHA